MWKEVGRPNVLIKVPGTQEGLPAIEQLLSEGININITLLFGLPRYRAVALAYQSALERRFAKGLPIERVASVASFFLSRIDALVDPQLDQLAEGSVNDEQIAHQLRGEVAIASAKLAYQIYQQLFQGERFAELAEHGRTPSAYCGPAPAPRTRHTAT